MMRKSVLVISAWILLFFSILSWAGMESHFISGHLSGGGSGNTRWSDWDEATESGWGDSANTFIALMESTGAASNETGQGAGLTGADLVLTQSGSIAGATGSPPERALDGGNDYFTATATALTTILNDTSWTIIWKLDTIGNLVNDQYLCQLIGTDGDRIQIQGTGSNIQFLHYQNGAAKLNGSISEPSATGTVYVAIWSDGTYIKAGYCTTKPTKLTDFGANVVSATTGASAIDDMGTTRQIIGTSASVYWAGNVYYLIMSKSCLIDNAS